MLFYLTAKSVHYNVNPSFSNLNTGLVRRIKLVNEIIIVVILWNSCNRSLKALVMPVYKYECFILNVMYLLLFSTGITS